ncbi:MAG: M23 family metallopeptidase [Gemmatimonadaceae bacterium]
MRNRVQLALVLATSMACSDDSGPTGSGEGCRGYPAQATSVYLLPFDLGRAFRVTQGNCSGGMRTHRVQGPFQYAYDFDMAKGTVVRAARGGEVIAVVEFFPDGTRRVGDENYVLIRHTDGTFGRYFHLALNGASVVHGQFVAQGDVIGFSGDSGNSTGPHLHFDVAICADVGCLTLPIVFRNTRPHPNGLAEGQTYSAD